MSETEAPEKSLQERAADILSALTDALTAAGNKDERDAAWAGVQDAETIALLAEAYNENNTKIEQQVLVLGGLPSCSTRAAAFSKTIVRMARSLLNNERANQMLNSLGSVATVLDHLPPERLVPTTVLSQCRVPRGWLLNNEGVYKVNPESDPTRIALQPIFLVGRTQDILTGESHRSIIWHGTTGWCQRIVPRGQLAEGRRLLALAEYEAPVHTNNMNQIVGYLADFEAENGRDLPLVKSTQQLGWLPDDSFVLPDGRVSRRRDATAFALTPPEGFERTAAGVCVGGTFEGWLEMAELCSHWPFMMIGIYASLAAPLLHILDTPSFVIDFNGETTGGKTTLLRVAGSCWGSTATGAPSVVHSWDMTKVWLEQTAGFMGHLPVILDDTKRAKSNRVVRDVIYDFAFGNGRGRGARTGGTRKVAHWKSVLLSSGETAITSFSQDGGTRARVLELSGKPLGVNPRKGATIAEKLQHLASIHYGHMGRKFIDYLVENRDHWDQIREAFRQAQDRYAGSLQTGVARRHAPNLAAMEIAGEIAHRLGMPRPKVDVFGHLIRAAISMGSEADRPLAALFEVVTWCVQNQERFWGRMERVDTLKLNGNWAGVWEATDWPYIGIASSVLRGILEREGFHPPEIIDRWVERGYLVQDKTKVVRGPYGTRMRCYLLAHKAVMITMTDEAVEPTEDERILDGPPLDVEDSV